MLRTGIEAHRATAAMTIPFGANQAQIELITTEHARELVNGRKTEVTESTGCWISSGTPAHENGYKAVNLQNTISRVAGQQHMKVGIKKMYLHHLTLIADNRRDELGWCTQANNIFQVSHLCHVPGCFNPKHLKVEESARNRARNSCQGHVIIEYSGWGPMRYHPCVHGGELGEYSRCILPTRPIANPGSYKNEP